MTLLLSSDLVKSAAQWRLVAPVIITYLFSEVWISRQIFLTLYFLTQIFLARDPKAWPMAPSGTHYYSKSIFKYISTKVLLNKISLYTKIDRLNLRKYSQYRYFWWLVSVHATVALCGYPVAHPIVPKVFSAIFLQK